MAAKDLPTVHIRIEPALLKQLKIAAAQNSRSLNKEIALRLTRSFDISDAARDTALQLLAEVVSIIDKGKTRG